MNEMNSINANKKIKGELKKSSQPLVTIVTATYNLIKQGRKNWFIQNLESVRSQTYSNIEHIIIDGASTDGTLEILEEYQNKGWIKYYSEPDAGIYDAMNKGILKAKGKYVVCLNSDDFYCEKHAVEWLVMKAEETDADACYGNAYVVDPNSLKIKRYWEGKTTIAPWRSAWPCHQTFLIKTEVMKELGLYDLKYKFSADNNFLLRLWQHNKKFTEISAYIVSFREGGISSIYVRESDQDQIDGLFSEYGQYHGLTRLDVSRLYGFNFLKIPLQEAILLGAKLVNTGEQNWVKEYFSRLLSRVSQDSQNLQTSYSNPKKIYRLFGFLPILKIKCSTNKTNVRLFCFIPFLKIQKRSENDTRVYLFSFIPLLRFKKTNRHKYVNLFNAIPLWKVNK